jgi:hypothetical protein
MPAGEDGTVGVVENLGGGGAEKHLAENAGVGRHDDEVESAMSRGKGDFGCGVAE